MDYKIAFWILFICYPIVMTFIERYGWKRGFKKGCHIGQIEEKIKNPKNDIRLNELIDWLRQAKISSIEQSDNFKERDMQSSWYCSEAMSAAYTFAIEKANSLIQQDKIKNQ